MTSPLRRHLPAVLFSASLALALGACGPDDADDPASSTSPSPAASSPESPATSPEPTPDEGEEEQGEQDGEKGRALPLYFVTDSPAGPRLIREFHRVEGDPLTEAARLVTGAGEPIDPDYRTLWPLVEITSVTATDGVLLVEVPGDGFTERPDGMSQRDARLAVQQLVHTLQGVQQERVPVVFRREDGITSLFGLPTDRQYRPGSPLETLNHVNITEPSEGTAFRGDSLRVVGVANSFEANVVCEVLSGDEVVASTPLTAEGWMEDRLFPFAGDVSVGDAPAGDLELRCSTEDPSDGEGPGPFTDTRTITRR